jgi:hypothetical protein
MVSDERQGVALVVCLYVVCRLSLVGTICLLMSAMLLLQAVCSSSVPISNEIHPYSYPRVRGYSHDGTYLVSFQVSR